MNRAALEHILRAASAITNEREFIVIGSQSILGQYPNAPDSLLVSIEADVYPRYAPERSDIVDGAIGELSQFHQTFGYYAHGVDQTTAVCLQAGSTVSSESKTTTQAAPLDGAWRPMTWLPPSSRPVETRTCDSSRFCSASGWSAPTCSSTE